MGKKKNWEEFVQIIQIIRNAKAAKNLKKSMDDILDDEMSNFLFLANSEEPDHIVIRGMHYPDSGMLDVKCPTIFETSDKNTYIAAFRESSIEQILNKIRISVDDEESHSALWQKSLEFMLSAAEDKISAGNIHELF